MKAAFVALAAAGLALGCRVPDSTVVAAKATVFGLEVASDPTTGGPRVRLGLIRYYLVTAPVSTNVLHAPAFASDTDAAFGFGGQKAREGYRVGGAAPAFEQGPLPTPAPKNEPPPAPDAVPTGH